MKKFLSLLLTLTMVMSLVVLPARADNTCAASPSSTVSLTLGGEGQSVSVTGAPDGATFTWTSASDAIATVSGSDNSATISPVAAGETTVTCTVHSTEEAEPDQDVVFNVTVSNPIDSLSSGTFKGRQFTNKSVVYFENERDSLETANLWTVSGYKVNSATVSGSTCTLNLTSTSNPAVTGTMNVTVALAALAIKATIEQQVTANTIIAGGKVKLEIQNTNLPSSVTYKWVDGSGAQITSPTAWAPTATATAKCQAYLGEDNMVAESNTLTIDVIKDNFELRPTTALSPIYLSVGERTNFPAVKLYTKGASGAEVADRVKYAYSSANAAIVSVNTATGEITGAAASSTPITVTLTAVYQGKEYKKEVNVSVVSLAYTLPPVSNGSAAQSYYQSSLESYAAQLIAQRTNRNDVTIRSMTVKSVDALGGQFYPATGALANGFSYTAPKAALGNAKMVVTAVSSAGSFDITFVIPVTPIGTVFDAQYPQANNTSAWNNNSSYTITPPSGFDRFIVVNKTGTAPTDFSQYNANPGSTSAIIYDSDFSQVTGKCTLYVIAWNTSYNAAYNSSGKYSSGMLEVSRQNYDIEYTGVAGTTVNFKDNDFTNFLNNVTGANTNKSTSTYYYFSHVTFSSFNNASQGVLYYNNLAMGGSGLSSFNASTKISNLSNVSFAINGKTSSKQIVLNFTLYATEYRSNGLNGSSTKVRDNVPFYGRVVINVVREDVKISVAPGDSLRLSDSAFLNYLNSYSNAYRNASIDYVTFDQSALTNSKNTANLTGALYTYYSNSYSFGSPVKTTDHFYYAPRYNQASLSDVAFYALPYATVGTTVYIPFTIKPQSSNASVSGTLAVTIAQSMNFTDVKQGDYCYDAVKWAIGKDITKGTSATTFSPNSSCTLAQIVTFLWRAAGKPTVSASARCPFTDVYPSMGSDYYNAILWAVSKGITTGTS
ncbi:MAG: S-layer homology domain-containing protein, partial [Oscillospiraceae bacterium]|nr:S-layer homology domain-containing protein [Oscillospiraceae bacterium]